MEQAIFLDDVTLLESALFDAHKAAHNVQDFTFCARTTARFNAITIRWWQPGGFDVVSAAEQLREEPEGAAFAPLHVLDEDYTHRNPLSDKAELPYSILDARELKELAVVYRRPLPEFRRLNEEYVPSTAALAELVCVPDPKFQPQVAARFAAEALVDDKLAPQQRVELIQSLVPLAVVNPTALDTVLMRLLLAAFPMLDAAALEDLAQIAPIPDRSGDEGAVVTGVPIDRLG